MKYNKFDCGIILIDLSGFTNLIYKSKHNEEMTEVVMSTIYKMFGDYIVYDEIDLDIKIINTTGDGFFAISTGSNPCYSALKFSKKIEKHFEKEIKPIFDSLNIDRNIDLRIALNYGSVCEIKFSDISSADNTMYISDDLNKTARIINCQTARTDTYALSKSFHERLFPTSSQNPCECIQDENEYPERIEIFRMEE